MAIQGARVDRQPGVQMGAAAVGPRQAPYTAAAAQLTYRITPACCLPVLRRLSSPTHSVITGAFFFVRSLLMFVNGEMPFAGNTRGWILTAFFFFDAWLLGE
jgi:hypothetical protein